ncbi:MAG: hypothetical protein COB04_18405 [Gammaproteobacteria bacterium]|nr:MAG: hypothetical protein COB04_18405 [Gammaproteobacteria bacterium]
MQFNFLDLKAGIRSPVAAYGKYFLVYTCTGTVVVEFEYLDGKTSKTDFRQRRGGPTDQPFKNIWITSPIDQTIDVGWSDQVLIDNDIGGSVTAEGLIEVVTAGGTSRTVATITVAAATATKLLTADTSRLSAVLSLTLAGRIGVDNTVSAVVGFPVVSGSKIADSNTSELWIYSTAGGTVDIIEDIK